MTTVTKQEYHFTVESQGEDEFKRYLQGTLNGHHEAAYPLMGVPASRRFAVRVTDDQGQVVGGALVWAYWGWLDISLVALQEGVRGGG